MSGSVFGVDYGTKRIGLAITDPGRSFVFGRETLVREGGNDAQRVALLAKEESAVLLAIGLPLNADGTEGGMAAAARAFGAAVGTAAGLPVVFVDERYTSIEADEHLKERFPKDTRKRKSMRDRAAAILILRTFLEHGPLR